VRTPAAAAFKPASRDTGSIFQYDDDEFFPIDGLLLGNQGRPHNFDFLHIDVAADDFAVCPGLKP
jgi:hypothetical protein